MGDHLKEKTPHKMEEENKICKPICFAYFQAFLLQSSMFIGAIKVTVLYLVLESRFGG
jgi:hypothetical protein